MCCADVVALKVDAACVQLLKGIHDMHLVGLLHRDLKPGNMGVVPGENNGEYVLKLFDFGMIDYAQFLISRGTLCKPYYANILLGSLGTLSATPYNLASMVRALPEGTVWSGAGIGRFQFYVNSMAVTMGGHVRVGLEDNLFYDPVEKTQPATNAGLIDRVVKVARAVWREIASPPEARQIIGLPPSGNPKFRELIYP